MIILSYILIALGIIGIITSIIGCNRLPDYFSKMHAATIGDVVGCPLLLFGIALQSNYFLKISFLSLIILIVNPASTYFLNLFATYFFENKNANK